MKKLMMAAMAAAAMVAAAEDYSFTYQAELKDASGAQPLTGNQNVEIRLWKTANTKESGDLLWGRGYSVYLDKDGLFNLEVSDAGSDLKNEPFPAISSTLQDVLLAKDAGTVFIGLTVEGSTEIVPRQRIFAVPYAAKANRSLGLTGASSPVEGIIKFKQGGEISSSGITLMGDDSSITVDQLNVQTINASGNIATGSGNTVSAGNLAFTGKLTKDSTEVLPVPVGGIILWFKTTSPEGDAWLEDSWSAQQGKVKGKSEHWAICDGNNGTPDLKGRFVVGVGQVNGTDGTDYALGQNDGGAETVALTTKQMPAHRHKYVSDDGLNGISEDYAHCTSSCKYNQDFDSTNKKGKHLGDYQSEIVGGNGTEGESVAHENRPPYYALYYIMRVK